MKLKNLSHYFLPHPETHEKAHLLHWHFLIIYLLLFILLRVGFDLIAVYNPGVLGVNSDITVDQIIADTNVERGKLGLPPLRYNEQLSQAAAAKAQNMFTENYWAHFSPSGKDPWGFINKAGYKFTYAGENLARNFQNSDDVVKAWMNSPSHRENIVNNKYQEIGVAVVDGVLLGQKTTLVVQMFGSSGVPTASITGAGQVAADKAGQRVEVTQSAASDQSPIVTLGTQLYRGSNALVDPYSVTKNVGLGFVMGIGILLLIDLVVLKRRGVLRISSHHITHMSLLAIAGSTLLSSHGGSIL